MTKFVTALVLLLAMSGIAAAQLPDISTGPPGDPVDLSGRQDVCQYGFVDTTPGSGWTLGLGQQLGIHCPGPITICAVGFYVEFMVVPGTVEVVIYDGATEVQRTAVFPAEGVNEFDVPDIVVNDACIMLCPVGNYWSVTGEDYNSAPYTSSYWSNNCTCQNVFTDNNLLIWAVTGCEPSPTDESTWGALRMLYR